MKRLALVSFERSLTLATLQTLKLDQTQLKGDNLYKLAELPRLEFLTLPKQVEREAVKDLQSRLSSLKIEVGGLPFRAEKR